MRAHTPIPITIIKLIHYLIPYFQKVYQQVLTTPYFLIIWKYISRSIFTANQKIGAKTEPANNYHEFDDKILSTKPSWAERCTKEKDLPDGRSFFLEGPSRHRSSYKRNGLFLSERNVSKLLFPFFVTPNLRPASFPSGKSASWVRAKLKLNQIKNTERSGILGVLYLEGHCRRYCNYRSGFFATNTTNWGKWLNLWK